MQNKAINARFVFALCTASVKADKIFYPDKICVALIIVHYSVSTLTAK
jgi:hypothetical protein